MGIRGTQQLRTTVKTEETETIVFMPIPWTPKKSRKANGIAIVVGKRE